MEPTRLPPAPDPDVAFSANPKIATGLDAARERLVRLCGELEFYLRHCVQFEEPPSPVELRGSITDRGGGYPGAVLQPGGAGTAGGPDGAFTHAVAAFYDRQIDGHNRRETDLRRRLDPRWSGWREALALLRVEERLTIEVWVVENRSRAEAAELLGIAETTATERKTRGLKAMVRHLTARPARPADAVA